MYGNLNTYVMHLIISLTIAVVDINFTYYI